MHTVAINNKNKYQGVKVIDRKRVQGYLITHEYEWGNIVTLRSKLNT